MTAFESQLYYRHSFTFSGAGFCFDLDSAFEALAGFG
jgi:hypothetical protein